MRTKTSIFNDSFNICENSKKRTKDAEEFKILLDIDQKIILLDHQNNFVGILKNNEQCCKKY